GLGDLLGPAARQVVEVLTALDPLRGASVAVPCREAVGPLGLPAADADLRAGLRAGDVLEMGEHRAPVAAAPVLRVHLDAEPGVVEVVVVRGPDARECDRFAAVQTDPEPTGLAVPAMCHRAPELADRARLVPRVVGGDHRRP